MSIEVMTALIQCNRECDAEVTIKDPSSKHVIKGSFKDVNEAMQFVGVDDKDKWQKLCVEHGVPLVVEMVPGKE